VIVIGLVWVFCLGYGLAKDRSVSVFDRFRQIEKYNHETQEFELADPKKRPRK
jgi:hypothetical protein